MNAKILELVESLQKDYKSLLDTATKLSSSNNPAERAMAYEINIFVADQSAKTKKILEGVALSEVITPGNGYGALAE